LKNHLEETNNQIKRLEKVFEKLGKAPSGTQCPAIDGEQKSIHRRLISAGLED
jgi:ferritin-like metal-binding protein YciE